MPQGSSAPRASERGGLFAERQVYLRSGASSHYVLLSRSLQIGVVIGLCVAVASLAFASYGFVTTHLQAVAQERELARLEALNESLRAAAETAREEAAQLADAGEQMPPLRAALAEAQAARDRAVQLAEAAAAESEELRRELALVEERVGELAAAPVTGDDGVSDEPLRAANARIEELSAERGALAAQVEELTALAERQAAEAEALSTDLAAARAATDDLEQQLADATAETARLTNQLATTGVNGETAIAQLSQRLEDADRQIARLSDDLAAATARADEAEAALAAAVSGEHGEALALAEIKADGGPDDLRRPDEDLAVAQATIASLSAELEVAKAELADARAETTTNGVGAAPSGDVDLGRLQEQLAQANQRIRELEQRIERTAANLAILPSPAKPR